MFQVTRENIAALNDTDLRLLVGMLAEEEVRKAGHSPSSVTYGGDQRAADGGIDVRVEIEMVADLRGYVPRAPTGFQVKAEDMPRSKILKEMYAKFGVTEYWVVDVKAECIHVFSQPDERLFQSRETVKKSESLSPKKMSAIRCVESE